MCPRAVSERTREIRVIQQTCDSARQSERVTVLVQNGVDTVAYNRRYTSDCGRYARDPDQHSFDECVGLVLYV
jgi:hypothetical protein